jgi:hypothetical protein
LPVYALTFLLDPLQDCLQPFGPEHEFLESPHGHPGKRFAGIAVEELRQAAWDKAEQDHDELVELAAGPAGVASPSLSRWPRGGTASCDKSAF